MDPEATLARWRRAVKNGDGDEATEAAEDLREWIRRGGFEPKWKNKQEREAIRTGGRRDMGRIPILRAQARALRKDISGLADRHGDHTVARRIKHIAAELNEVETELAALEGK
jgi:hypothetical protein